MTRQRRGPEHPASAEPHGGRLAPLRREIRHHAAGALQPSERLSERHDGREGDAEGDQAHQSVVGRHTAGEAEEQRRHHKEQRKAERGLVVLGDHPGAPEEHEADEEPAAVEQTALGRRQDGEHGKDRDPEQRGERGVARRAPTCRHTGSCNHERQAAQCHETSLARFAMSHWNRAWFTPEV